MNTSSRHVPPPAIGSDRVIAYAFVDASVTFTGKKRLFVDDELLGAVPCIAICKSMDEDLKDYLILYCDEKWNVLGVMGRPSYAKALDEVERCYQGIVNNFVRVNHSEHDVR